MRKAAVRYTRNPIYIFYALGAVLLYLYLATLINRGGIGPLEQAVFDVFYRLSNSLRPVLMTITQLGSLGFALILSAVFLIFRRDIGLRLLAASVSAYFVAQWLKDWVVRFRPEQYLDYIVPRDGAVGTGFPSGHMATATALGLVLALYAPRWSRKWILLAVLMVGISRIYLGVHFPLDIVGGYAVGLFCYSIVNLVFGSVYHPISSTQLAKRLRAGGLTGLTLKPAKVDARGSVPFFGTFDRGPVFVKVFNKDNNTADWLFKLTRRLRYRRLEDEVPSLTPKRAIEHEAYVTMLASQVAGIRVPELLGIYKVKTSCYAMATMRLDAEGLDNMDKAKVSDALLDRVWQQVTRLHQAHIIHKDLRTANIMIERSTNDAWLIDFGFGESATTESSTFKDNVELIASSASLVGAKRAVAAASRALGTQKLQQLLPYMQYAVLSGATTTALKADKQLLESIRTEMRRAAGIKKDVVKNAQLTRISKNNLFQFAVIILLFLLLLPQVGSLKDSMSLLKTTNVAYFALALFLSFCTYVWASLNYSILSEIPVAFRRLFVVQWAGSFANRLLPAGIGAISLNTLFFKKHGYNAGQAGTIVAVSNVLGLLGNISLILVSIIIWSNSYDVFNQVEISAKSTVLVVLILAIILAILAVLYHRIAAVRSRLQLWYRQSVSAIKSFANRPYTLISALFMQALITLTYTSVMYVSAYALDVEISIIQALFAVTMGSLFGSLIPTPGGIVGAEAGIVAAFSIVGISTEVAIAIALLYRLATFWLTIPPGYIAYRYALAKNYFD